MSAELSLSRSDDVRVSETEPRIDMKASEAEARGWKCPACGGKTAQDVKRRGFVRHLERFSPGKASVPRNSKGQCQYGRQERD
jgi:hypothetical protein